MSRMVDDTTFAVRQLEFLLYGLQKEKSSEITRFTTFADKVPFIYRRKLPRRIGFQTKLKDFAFHPLKRKKQKPEAAVK